MEGLILAHSSSAQSITAGKAGLEKLILLVTLDLQKQGDRGILLLLLSM